MSSIDSRRKGWSGCRQRQVQVQVRQVQHVSIGRPCVKLVQRRGGQQVFLALATCSHVLPRRLVALIGLVSGEDCVFAPLLSGGSANKLLESRLAKVCPDHGACSAAVCSVRRTSVRLFIFPSVCLLCQPAEKLRLPGC